MLKRLILGTLCFSSLAMFSLFAEEEDPNAAYHKRFEAIPVPEKTPFDTVDKRREMYLTGYRNGYFWAEGPQNHFTCPTNPNEWNGPAIRGWIEGWQAGAQEGGTGGLPPKYGRFLAWDAAAANESTAWSKPVHGLQARLSLSSKEVVAGTPILSTYLELRNVADVANVMGIPLDPETIQFTVTNADGKTVSPTNGPFDGMTVPLGMTRLPYDSTLRFNISARGAGIQPNAAAHLDLGPSSNWSFPQSETGSYFLQAKFNIAKANNDQWWGTIEIPKIKIPVTGK